MEWVSDWKQGKKEKEGREDERQEKEREKEGEGKQMGMGTYKVAMRTVFLPVILGVNVAPMAVMSLSRYSRISPV